MSKCKVEIMETWRRVLVDWINAVNVNDAELLNSHAMDDGTLFFLLIKRLNTIQGLDVITRQRLMEFIQIHHLKCPPGEISTGDNVDGTYLTSLLLVNSSLSEGLHHFLCSNLDPVTKNRVDLYLSTVLSIRDRISRDIIEMIVANPNEFQVKRNEDIPIDLSRHQPAEQGIFRIDNHTKIDKVNRELNEKLENCQVEKKKMAEYMMEVQEQLQQSKDEMELLKNKCELFEKRHRKASQYISSYASSIDSINLMVKTLVSERNALRCRLNELHERVKKHIDKIPLHEVTSSSHNNYNENSDNNDLSIGENNFVKSNNCLDNNKLRAVHVRLERLDQKIIDNMSNRKNNKPADKEVASSECVAPMRAKRERIHGRECWKIVPYTCPQKQISSHVKECNINDNSMSNNINNYFGSNDNENEMNHNTNSNTSEKK